MGVTEPSRARRPLSWALTTLPLLGCTLGERVGDGLQATPAKPAFVDVAPAQRDGGPADLGLSCVDVPSFRQFVGPIMLTDCVPCHDGRKPLATMSFELTSLRSSEEASQATACASALQYADTVDPSLSPILLLVDPADRTTDHEFRYATNETFSVYKAALLRWLEKESWPP